MQVGDYNTGGLSSLYILFALFINYFQIYFILYLLSSVPTAGVDFKWKLLNSHLRTEATIKILRIKASLETGTCHFLFTDKWWLWCRT